MKIRTWCLETIPIRTYSTSSHSNLVNRTYCPKPTPYYGPLCAISLYSYGWDVRNTAKFSPKSFFDFFDFLTNCSYDSNESESEGKRLKPTPLPHMRLWFCYWSTGIVAGMGFPTFVADHGCVSSPPTPNMMIHMALA